MRKKNIARSGFRHLLLLLFILFSIKGYPVNYPVIPNEGNMKDLGNTEWQLYKEFTGILVYYRSIACNDNANGIYQQKILLKFVNTTDTDLKISWKLQLWYNGNCLTCNDRKGEYSYDRILKGGGFIEGSCDEHQDGMNIFSKFLNYKKIPELTNFEMGGVTVTPL